MSKSILFAYKPLSPFINTTTTIALNHAYFVVPTYTQFLQQLVNPD